MTPDRSLLLFLCACLSISAVAIEQRSLIELLEHRVIELKPVGLGGHSGECLKVEVRNRSTGPIQTSIPVGWVFTSQEPEVQDLIVVREEVIALGGGASRSVTCRAFCCEASGTGPDVGEAYRNGRPASEKLTAVAMAVARGDFPNGIAQNAIWVLSDGNDIESMGAMDSTAQDTLRLAVSRISGQPVPLYSLKYAEEEGRVCSQRPASIHRRIRYDAPAGTEFTAVVLDRNGRVVRVLHDHEWLEPGSHTIDFQLDVHDWPPGTYAIHAHSADRAGVHRMPFTL
ncbi:MAG: hypothetical protein IPP83_04410 [Flavobacteriales bacterium]|nr:hypothetical protein [Flavobacteriales bacterium]